MNQARSLGGLATLFFSLAMLSGCPSSSAPPGGTDAGPGTCTGTATPCGMRSATDCTTQAGCRLGACSGTAAACSTFSSQTSCVGQAGCAWSGTACTGTAMTCEVITSDGTCAATMGCTWSASACGGFATPCGAFAQDRCMTQPGCHWTPGDAGVSPDAGGMDSGSAPDTGTTDAGTMLDANRPDTNSDSGVPPGCDLASGIECDGDWMGMCTPACAATECCSPQHGRFACVARDAAGACPAADLFIDVTRIDGTNGQYRLTYDNFDASACEIMEGCVDAPGLRRLLRFSTWTPNQGTADMFLGTTPPAGVSTGPFEWSSCHNHHHFTTYAYYELLRADGTVAATGHKQAFCLEDYYNYPCGGPGQPMCGNGGARYSCGYQGIQMGFQDVYYDGLPCQWIDVTDVPEGDYELHITVNGHHILNESNYDNNEITVPISITPPPPDVDVTMPCSGTGTMGLARDCGWTRATAPGVGTCTPGSSVTLGCSAGCGLGTCTGDTVMRVCDGSHDPTCTSRWVLAQNDDSTCPGSGRCGTMGDCCSEVTFTCPASGTYAAFWGGYRPGDPAATCNVAAR